MARKKNTKLKILYLKDMLEEASREGRALTMRDLIDRLNELGIAAERKSIGDDLSALKTYGLPIARKRNGRASGYFLRPDP